MKVIITLISAALVLTLMLVPGCSDRGANSAPTLVSDSGILVKPHVFYDEMLVQIRNDYQLFFFTAYTPKVQEWGPPPTYRPTERLPMLVLLPPHDGTEYYYFNHGLAQIANELIESGEIDPMIIVCPSNDKVLGGYFWSGNGGGSGNYDTLIGNTMIDYLQGEIFSEFIDSDPEMTAIGGIGSGAYGAYRAALLNPGTFGSISAIDGPLDFDGADGNSGLIDLFDDCLIEQGLLGNADFADEWDSSGAYHLGRLFMGGSLAFSPHDTLVKPLVVPRSSGNDIFVVDSAITDIDTIQTLPVLVTDTTWTQLRFSITDSTTLVNHIIGEGDYSFHFHLPFDENGDVYAPIWDLWTRNNLETIYADSNGAATLAGTDLWLATSTDVDQLGYNTETQSWIAFLQTNGLDPDVLTYAGTADNPAAGDEYLNYLLRELLIFHSNSFRAAQAVVPGK